MSSAKPSFLTEEEKQEFQGYDFQFENIVLEGGGSKGIAYIGAVRVSYDDVGHSGSASTFGTLGLPRGTFSFGS